MLKRFFWIAATAAVVALASVSMARADCYHNGAVVPEGSRVGGLICVNGTWQPG